MAEKKEASSGGVNEGKVWAILSYIFILWIFPLWVIKPRKDFAVYHAKQAFMLFIAAVVINIVGSIIPFVGWFIILPIGGIIVFILWIIGIVNSASGKKKPLPIIGKWAEAWFKGI